MMFASAWKMRSFVAATVAVLMVQSMVMDVHCDTTTRTATQTQEGSSMLNLPASPSLKSILSVVAASAAYYFLTSAKASAEVSESNAKNTDIVNNFNVPVEVEQYLKEKVDVGHDEYEYEYSDAMGNDNYDNEVDDYEAPGEEDSTQWLDAGVRKFGNSVKKDYLPRAKRSTSRADRMFKRNQDKCDRKRKQILTKFERPIKKQVEKNDTNLILPNGRGKKMKNQLEKMRAEDCDNAPAKYVGPVGRGGFEYPKLQFILNGMTALQEWANSLSETVVHPIYDVITGTNAPVSENSKCSITQRKLTESVQSELHQAIQYRRASFSVDTPKKAGIVEKINKIRESGCTPPFVVIDSPESSDEFTLKVNDLDYINRWAAENSLPLLRSLDN